MRECAERKVSKVSQQPMRRALHKCGGGRRLGSGTPRLLFLGLGQQRPAFGAGRLAAYSPYFKTVLVMGCEEALLTLT